jgi:hypothetical protein
MYAILALSIYKVISDFELRIALNRRLDLPLSDAEWAFLESQRYLADLRSGRLPIDALAEKVRQMRRAFGTAPPEPRQRASSLPVKERTEAVAAVLAEKLLEFARPWREKTLGGQLLSEDKLETWLESQAAAADESLLAEFPVRQAGDDFVPSGPARRLRNLILPSPGGKFWFVRPGSELDELRQRAEAAQELFGIPAAEAVRTILTGLPPRLEPIRISAKFKYTPAASRIYLEIDPALTPAEVSRAYGEYRKQILKGRARKLSRKHLELAKFMCSRPEGEKGREAMAAWNRKFRQWKYTQVTNFLRDAAAAKRRLLRPGNLDLKGGDE